jgi:hypothetical protein
MIYEMVAMNERNVKNYFKNTDEVIDEIEYKGLNNTGGKKYKVHTHKRIKR